MMPSRAVPLLLVAVGCGGARADEPSSSREPSPPLPPPGASSTPGPSPAGACDASAASDIGVASSDLDGYPPYAVVGCSLVYVGLTGALLVRDLATGAETTLAPASEAPKRPAASTELVAWEARVGDRSVVRVRAWAGATTATIEGGFAAASEPRVSQGSVTFTAWPHPGETGDADVWLYESGAARPVISGLGQQRFSDVSERYVVATDFSEDPDGRYDGASDLADLVVHDRQAGTTVARKAPGKQAFPMLVDADLLGYLDWVTVHPEPKLEGYDLRVGAIAETTAAADRTLAHVTYRASEPVRPAVADGVFVWVANPEGTTLLFRAPADGSSPPSNVLGLDGLVLHAPAPSRGGGFTVLATVRPDAAKLPPRLRAIDHRAR